MPSFNQTDLLLQKPKLIRITTVPIALAYPLNGQPSFMHNHGYEVLLVSAAGKELDLVKKQEECPHTVVPMTRKITPLKDLKALYLLIRLFRKEKPAIVHTETPKAGLLGMIAAWFCRVPIRIHTVAGLPLMVAHGLTLKILQAVEMITYAAATQVWPNSNSLKEYILKHRFCSPGKLTVIGQGSSNGIDTLRFHPDAIANDQLNEIKDKIQYNPQACYLLFVGRLVKDKGIVELVTAFKALKKQIPGLKLMLVGQYEEELDPIPEDIYHEILHNRDILHVSWTDKVEYYMALANYFVFPTYREGFPNVLLEAAAMQLPILCSRIGGNTDIVTENTGSLFAVKDTGALKEAIQHALQQADEMKQKARTLHAMVIEKYKREVFWQHMLQEYNKLVKENKRLHN